MNLVAFRNLEDLGYTPEQVKAFAAEYTVTGRTERTTARCSSARRCRPTISRRRSPMSQAAAAANNGAAPPDFSLIAKARAPERGFPTFVFDIFTQYAENGPDYIYSLLTGYDQEVPEGVEVAGRDALQSVFHRRSSAGHGQAARPTASVTYDDGSPETVDQYARDVSAFLMWAAEPHLVERKALGFKVFVFLAIFAALLYLVRQQVWADVKKPKAA